MSKKPGDPSATILDLVSPGPEDAALTTKNVTAASIFLTDNRPSHFTNMAHQTITGVLTGAAEFGEHAVFFIPTLGDYISWFAIEVELTSWFPHNVAYFISRGEYGGYTYIDPSGSWSWANSLGTAIIERVWFEIDGVEYDGFPGEWIDVWSRLFLPAARSFSLQRDCLGRLPPDELIQFRPLDLLPTETGRLLIPIPTWSLRHRRGGAIPLAAMKEGSFAIHVQFRPFADCVRIQTGKRASCSDTPLSKHFSFLDTRIPFNNVYDIVTPANPPRFRACNAKISFSSVEGEERKNLLHAPVVQLIQPVQTFYFDAPMRFALSAAEDHVIVNLPLEAAHPVDGLIWFLRRRAVRYNNEWTNYSATIESDISGSPRPLLRNATIQINGQQWISENEAFFRSSYAGLQSGISTASNAFIYHYSFGRCLEDFQPGGTVNASQCNIRLVLDVRNPDGAVGDTQGPVFDGSANERGWEVYVFVLYRNWLRFQNGLTAPIFEQAGGG